ncbi:MAG: CDP-alcohol phosphatidyltransferase family protein [Gammaproteobacteria bacterium]
MANLVTFLRLFLVFIITALVEYAPPMWQLLNVFLLIIIMALDGLDGIIARFRKEDSLFGAIFDIAADRIIEITLWITLLGSGFVSVWVPIIFVVRGVLVDNLRKKYSDSGRSPFSIMQTKWGQFLVASRTMRFTYGGFKLITFAWLLFLFPATQLWSAFFTSKMTGILIFNDFLIYSTVILCLLRGLPVIFEAIILANPLVGLRK